MILTRIKLAPFAGISDLEIEFKKGLNVILGPNESGKSTVFDALHHVLFTKSKLSPFQLDASLGSYFPINGGDTIQVILNFQKEFKHYRLKKCWGATNSAELTLPEGGFLTDDTTIRKKMNSILTASQGTYQSVLMTPQSSLAETIDQLKNKYKNTLNQLGDILRSAILETDGVSIDAFHELLKKKTDEYFGRWDEKTDMPEKGRGIENPWKQNTGKILNAYYEKEWIRDRLEKTIALEKNLDSLNSKISVLKLRLTKTEGFLEQYRKIVDDAMKQKEYSLTSASLTREIETYKKDNTNWPLKKQALNNLEKEILHLKNQLEHLRLEKSKAEQFEENRQLIEKFQRICRLKEKLDVIKRQMKSIPKLTSEDLKYLIESYSDFHRLRAKVEAGKLSARIHVKQPLSLVISKDAKSPVSTHLVADEEVTYTAGSRIIMEHGDWSIKVTSGTGDVNALLESLKKSEEDLDSIQNRLGVNDLNKAESLHHRYQNYQQQLNSLYNHYNDELDGSRYEELEEKTKEIHELKRNRPLVKITEAFIRTENQYNERKKQFETIGADLKELEKKYNNHDSLLSTLSESIQVKIQLKQKMEKLSSVPEEFETEDAFIERFKQKENKVKQMSAELKAMEIQRAELGSPDQSSEELQTQFENCNETFVQLLERGRSIAKVSRIAAELRGNLDQNTFLKLREDIERYLSVLTDNRYKNISMKNSIPTGFIRNDGNQLGSNLLSTGTKDTLSLAVRLSMASYFLSGSDGFLALDDPLVDLDPDRQKRAAEILNDYAKSIQLLIFTCHPLHANLFSGNQIDI